MGRWPAWQVTIFALILVCAVIELGLTLSDYGILLPAHLRQVTYEYGAFWPGLLTTWEPNYRFQSSLMFVTYSFLHSGPLHLGVNMVTLYSLGRAVGQRTGLWGFVAVYSISLLGGAASYGWLAKAFVPMVGASGALFGLAGAVLAWEYVDRFTLRERLWPVARAVLILAGLNVLLWYAMAGQLAWQTHLGGFVAGWIAALLVDPRPRADDDEPDATA